ncbi:MAG: hypothetical protein ACI81R_001748, partial [Bradymonadia bacterium]
MPRSESWRPCGRQDLPLCPALPVSGRSPSAQRATELWALCASPRTLGATCIVWASLQLLSLAPHTSSLNPALRFGAVLVAFSAVCFASELAVRSGASQLATWRDVTSTIFVSRGRRSGGGSQAAFWLSLAIWALIVTPALVGYLEALPGSARGHLRIAEGEVGESFIMATPAPGTRRSLGADGLQLVDLNESGGEWVATVQARRSDSPSGVMMRLPVGGRALVNDATIVFRGVEYEARVGGVVLEALTNEGQSERVTLSTNGVVEVGDSTLRLVSVESDVLGQLGAAAQVSVAREGGQPEVRWIYERAPDGFDSRHHEGVALSWASTLPVRGAVFAVRLGPAAWLQSLSIWCAWF